MHLSHFKIVPTGNTIRGWETAMVMGQLAGILKVTFPEARQEAH